MQNGALGKKSPRKVFTFRGDGVFGGFAPGLWIAGWLLHLGGFYGIGVGVHFDCITHDRIVCTVTPDKSV